MNFDRPPLSRWTQTELGQLAEAKRRGVCALQPKWGKCEHTCCRRLWALTPERATDEERAALWPLLQEVG
jgi:hypothetical protein